MFARVCAPAAAQPASPPGGAFHRNGGASSLVGVLYLKKLPDVVFESGVRFVEDLSRKHRAPWWPPSLASLMAGLHLSLSPS